VYSPSKYRATRILAVGITYMECVGHFHGESAGQYWPQSNQLGPHVRQLNNGHRHGQPCIKCRR
jgi:hypothetical protein